MSSEAARSGTDEQKSALVDRILRGEISTDDACREHGLTDAELKEWVGIYRRFTRRTLEDQLSAALSARGLPAEDPASSEFTGGLESMALAELLQTIEYGRKDAQIRVEHDGEQSQLWCEQGEIIDARSGRLAGAGAVYRLLSLREGRLYAHFSRVERARTIHASTPALLLEAAKRFDECRLLRERIGDTAAVYVVSPNAWDAQSQQEPETWQLLRAFDGVSSLERVIAASTVPELETLTVILSLLDRRLIMPRPAPTSPQWLPLSTQPESSSAPLSDRSFLPLAASLRARLTQPGPLRQRLWVSAAAGAGAVAVAFAVGFWSVRREAATLAVRAPTPARAVASAGDWANGSDGSCPQGMAKVAGGPLFAQSAVPLGAATGDSREPRIDSFCLGRLEVTVAEFDACVAASGCEQAQREYDLRLTNLGSSKQPADLAQQCNSGQSGRERHPVNCVSFQQAQQFCAWRGARLPTQSEWEYAASEVTPDPEEDHKGTLPVGTFPAGGSAEGILDLFGNVSEWTTGHVGLRGAADGDDSDRRQLYAVLGGGLQPGASRLGSRASRLYMNANARGRTVGFRCALALP
ncbi:MAG: hypothetical protein RL033_4059 [Pseudomonadota bacterium]